MNEEDMDSLREDRAKCLIAIEDMMRQLSEAIAPVRDWFESGEEYPAKTMIQIVVDAVAELQTDRETLLSTERQYRALKAECDARVSALESRLAEAEKDRDALTARVRELEEVAKPLADLAEELSPERCEPEDECGLFKVVGDETLDRRLRAAEIFRAARALKGEG